MRIRPNHIVGGVLVVLSLTIAFALMSTGNAKKKPASDSEDDFLASVREEAATDLSATTTEEGTIPAGGIDPSKVPAIDVPETFDAGVIPNDRVTKKVMPIRNTGTFDLNIMRLTTECACTLGEIKEKFILPGKEALMTITIDPRRIPGFTSDKRLTLVTNDPKRGTSRITVLAKVDPEFSVTPEKVDFGSLQKTQVAQAQVILRQVQDAPFVEKPFEVKDPKPLGENSGLTVSVTPRPESEWATPGKPEFVLDVSFDPSVVPPGPYQRVISMNTTAARLSTFRLDVQADVLDENGQHVEPKFPLPAAPQEEGES